MRSSEPAAKVAASMFQDLTEFGLCAFLMNPPFSLATDVANNRSMELLSARDRQPDRHRAFEQWHAIYRFLAAEGLVYVLPSTPGLQDLPFVANVGTVLPHLPDPRVVLANFRSLPRIGETDHADAWFQAAGLRTIRPPHYFEGEADLKFIRNNLYCGGFGLRSSTDAHEWFEKEFTMRVIPIDCSDPNLYHLDCMLLPLDEETVLLCTEACSPAVIRALEQEVEIIPVDRELAYRGVTNGVNCGRFLLCESHVESLARKDPLWEVETRKVRFLEATAERLGREPVFFDNSEFYKSGAMLSCMVLPLNYRRPSRSDGGSWLGA